ncbi:hypothetical protein DPSP01_006342 [Paraphaeosphaeria sporulosa]
MKTAFDELERTITPADARDFRTTSLDAVRMAALELEKRMEAKQALRNMRRLKPLLDGMEHYAKVVDILCNGTPFLPWIWAPITLILRVSSEYIEAFELLMKGYARIASNLGRFERLSSEFLTNQDFQQTLAVYYADILQFHKHAYIFIRRSGWRLLFITSWGRFQRRFDNLLEDLKRHGELIDSEANSHNIVEAGRMRTEIRQWREESLDQVKRDEEERASSHFRSVLSWLKIDESEQLSICDSIFDEGSKYPGTCSWVTRHTKIRLWLQQQQTNPVVWLQGNPGTGKSVASGQIVKFIDNNGHALVLRHFCTYSHAASTKYDNIVKSLLTQLIRKNGELVAHVYQECILSKKAPTITLLEQLVGALCASTTDEPGKMRYIWIVLDGLDECEQSKQSRLLTLMNQITSRSASEGNTVCKVLISSRPSSAINKYLRRKQVVSLSDEATQLYKSIQLYASQRLLSAIKRLRQLEIEHEDISELANNVATKAHGMFLYARLVLDYVTSNIFYNPDEIRDSINRLPPSLTEFYQTILAQMIKGLDARSVDRVKTILSWVSFAKRPLKKLELLSAVTVGQGNPEVDRLVPSYILDICGPLMEERRDSTFAFIHVSVKEFLLSAQGLISVSERTAIREHATATVTALLAGRRIFREDFDERLRLLQLVRGVHGLHVYATEFWIEYLLSDAALSNGPDVSSDLFALASRLAHELSAGRIESLPKELTAQPSDIDERLQLFQEYHPLYEQMKASLNSRSRKRLEVELFKQQDPRSVTDHSNALDAVSYMLQSYQKAVELLLNEESHPGVSAEELENFKSQFRASAFTCRLRSCPRATLGFENDSLRREHEMTHVGGHRCSVVNCQYPPFPSAKSLKNHTENVHNPDRAPKSIRHVGQLNGLIRPSYTRKTVTKQNSLEQNASGRTSFGVQSADTVPVARIQHEYDQVENGSVPSYRVEDEGSKFGDPTWPSPIKVALPGVETLDPHSTLSAVQEPGLLEIALDQVFEQESSDGVWQRLEATLKSFRDSGAVFSPQIRAMLMPPGIGDLFRKKLLGMTQNDFYVALMDACGRARKKRQGKGGEEMEEAKSISLAHQKMPAYQKGGISATFSGKEEATLTVQSPRGSPSELQQPPRATQQQPPPENNDPEAFGQLSGNLSMGGFSPKWELDEAHELEDFDFDSFLDFADEKVDTLNASLLSEPLTNFILSRQREDQDRILIAQQLLREDSNITSTFDDVPFVLGPGDGVVRQAVPSDLKTWRQLKALVQRNFGTFPKGTVRKLKELQVTQFLQLILLRSSKLTDASKSRESGIVHPQEAGHGFSGAFVNVECEECLKHHKKCDMSRPSCASCQDMGIHCEYKAPKDWNPASQSTLRLDLSLHEQISRAELEEIAARTTLDEAEKAGWSQSTIDQARKRHTEALSKLKNLRERLQDYQMHLMLLEQQNKKRLIKAREEQDAVATRTVTDPSSHLTGFTQNTNRQDIASGESQQQASTSPNFDLETAKYQHNSRIDNLFDSGNSHEVNEVTDAHFEFFRDSDKEELAKFYPRTSTAVPKYKVEGQPIPTLPPHLRQPLQPSSEQKPRNLRAACDACSRAKVKCNKVRPRCGRCEHMDIFCSYSPSMKLGTPLAPPQITPQGMNQIQRLQPHQMQLVPAASAQMKLGAVSDRTPQQQPNMRNPGHVQVTPQEIQALRSRLAPQQANATDDQLRTFIMQYKIRNRTGEPIAR